MAEPVKHEYLLDLSSWNISEADRPANVDVRSVTAADAEALADLMLEAYRGTIDYEGEEIEEAREAIAEFFTDAPRLDASVIARLDGMPASAVLVTSFDGRPFISYVVSHPTHKRRGLGAQAVTTACQRLAAAGEQDVRFGITDGNVASEAMFSKLGAVRLTT